MYKPLTEWFRKTLGKQVEKVAVSNKLVDEPAYIFTSQYGYSAQMEKINKAQAFANQEKSASYMQAKKTFELNPHHPVVKELLDRVKSAGGEPDEETTELGTLLFNVAMMNSGFIIEDPTLINNPVQKLLRLGFGLKKDAPIEEVEVDITDEAEEDENAEEEGGDGEKADDEEEPESKKDEKSSDL